MTTKTLDINTNVLQKRFTVYFDDGKHDPYKSKPWDVVDDFRKNADHYKKLMTVEEIALAFASGQFGILSEIRLVGKDKRLTSEAFVMSNIFTIDIDNDIESNNRINPVDVFDESNAQAMFYSRSHGIEKGNSYKLIYVLDNYINDLNILKEIAEQVVNELYENTGVHADTSAFNFQMPVRGGNPNYTPLIKEYPKRLHTDTYVKKAIQIIGAREKEFATQIESIEIESRKYSFEAYVEAAKSIGYIPSGGTYDYWSGLALSIKDGVNTNLFTYEEGLELFNIISGPEAVEEEHKFKYFRPRGKAQKGRTMASFIYEARKHGFTLSKYTAERPSYSDIKPLPIRYKESVIEIENFITIKQAKSILKLEKHTLVESPTGSGKTTAFINAMKELSQNDTEKNIIYILTVPTIALVDQNSTQHKLLGIKGGSRGLFTSHGEIVLKVKKNERVFITTWDKLPETVQVLRNNFDGLQFKIVVDEIHKFVTDYKASFRRKPISLLEKVVKREDVITYIGLSGTPEEVYKNKFDEVVKFTKKDNQSPAKNVFAIRFEREKDELPQLIEMIKGFINIHNHKVLVFIQSIPAIETILPILKKEHIKAVGITSKSKNDKVYKQIIKKETVPNDIDAILTTTVLAEGVNIINDSEKWTVITLSSPNRSKLFNLSTIRQMSNRLRNPYKHHVVFTQESKEEAINNRTSKRTDFKARPPFHLEGAFAYKTKRSKEMVSEINEFITSTPSKFFTGVIERSRGIRLNREDNLEIDYTYLRHHTVESREKYYLLYREAFINELEVTFNQKIRRGSFRAFKSIFSKDIDNQIKDTSVEVNIIEEEIRETEKEKAGNIRQRFTHEVYDAYQHKQIECIKEFEKRAVTRHIKTIRAIADVFSYPTCYLTVVNTNRDADIYKLLNDVLYLREYGYYELYKTRTKTWKVIQAMLKELGEYTPNDEYRNTLKNIQSKYKVNDEEIKKAERMLYTEMKRTKNTRKRKVRTRTFNDILDHYNHRWYLYDKLRELTCKPMTNKEYKKSLKGIRKKFKDTKIKTKQIRDEINRNFKEVQKDNQVILKEKCESVITDHELTITELINAMEMITENSYKNKKEKERLRVVVKAFKQHNTKLKDEPW